jgi:hypothetical protein
MKYKFIIITLSFALIITNAFAQTKLKTGIWRGELKTASGTEIPFNFDVKDVAGGKQELYVINSTERLKVTEVTTQGDSVFIRMPLFDSEFRLKLDGENLKGQWVRHLGERDATVEFSAQPNTSWRFTKTPEKPAYNVDGRWSAIIGKGERADTTVGEFKQNGTKLTGTFLTTTGDYRFLEWTVSGDKLYQ